MGQHSSCQITLFAKQTFVNPGHDWKAMIKVYNMSLEALEFVGQFYTWGMSWQTGPIDSL